MRALPNLHHLALATFTEGIRHRALWAIVCLAVLLIMANIFVAQLFTWDLGKVSVEFGLSAVALTGLLLVFFLGLKILADDLERHRISLIMSRPVAGWQYIVGKFLGLGMILLAAALILGLGAVLSMHYVLWQFPAYVPPQFSWTTYTMALASQWLGLVMMLAVSVFCFSFASQPFVALLLTVAVYFIGQNMELLRQVVVENTHAGILTGKEQVVVALSWIFPNLSLFDRKAAAAYGLAFGAQEFGLLLLYCLSYSALLLFLATRFFNRKELA